MERADEIFAERQINAGFAADARIHLREQRRGHLHEIDAPEECRRSKAAHIACDAAAERDDEIAARKAVLRQRFINPHDGGKLLLLLSRLKDEV